MSNLKKLSQILQTHLALPGTQLYFLRHGQSLANHAGSIVGWTDSKLSVKGREQSNQLFRAFHPYIDKFTQLHSSDLVRCRDSLNLALGFPSKKINLSRQLRELNFGDMEGVHFDSLPQKEKAVINSLKYSAPNGENWIQARDRAMEYLGTLKEGHHFICSHGGLMCALGYDIGLKYVVPNCSVVGFELDPTNKQLNKVNFIWEFEATS